MRCVYSTISGYTLNIDYVAGFFDGEGCARTTRVGYALGRKKLWKPVIEMSNTNKKVIEEIHNFIKMGKVYEYHPKRRGAKTQWRIYIWGLDIIKFCDLIKNKTIVKREILYLVREFAEYVESTKYKHKTWRGKHQGWTEEDIQFTKEKFVVPIRNLIRTSSNKGRRLIVP